MANKPERERERVCVGAKEGNKTPRECARFWATNASVRSSGNSSFQAPPCPATSFLRLPAASPFAFSPVMFLLFFRCALCCGSGGQRACRTNLSAPSRPASSNTSNTHVSACSPKGQGWLVSCDQSWSPVSSWLTECAYVNFTGCRSLWIKASCLDCYNCNT